MKYLIIPLVVAVMLFLTRVVRGALKKVSQNRMTRMEMFETIGEEWISLINAELPDDELVQRDPDRKAILEAYFKKEDTWVISIPLTDLWYGEFDLLLGVALVTDPQPQVRTTLSGLIITTDLRSWWSLEKNNPVHKEVAEKLSKIGRCFDIAEPEAL